MSHLSVDDERDEEDEEDDMDDLDNVEALDDLPFGAYDAEDPSESVTEGGEAAPAAAHKSKSVVHLLTRRESLRDERLLTRRASSSAGRRASSRKASFALGEEQGVAGSPPPTQRNSAVSTGTTRKRSTVVVTMAEDAAADSGTSSSPRALVPSVESLMRVRSSVDSSRLAKHNAVSSEESASCFVLDATDPFPFVDPTIVKADDDATNEDDDEEEEFEEVEGIDGIEGLEGGISGNFNAGSNDEAEADPSLPTRQRSASFSGTGGEKKKYRRASRSLCDLVSHRRSLDIGDDGNHLGLPARSPRRRSSISTERIAQLTGVRSTVKPRSSMAASVLEPEVVLAVDEEEQQVADLENTELATRFELRETAVRGVVEITADCGLGVLALRAGESSERIRGKIAADLQKMFLAHQNFVSNSERKGRTNVLVEYQTSIASIEGEAARLQEHLQRRNKDLSPQQKQEESPMQNASSPAPTQPPVTVEEDEEEKQLQAAIRAAKLKGVLAAESTQRANMVKDEHEQRLAVPQLRLTTQEQMQRTKILSAANPPRLTRLFTWLILEPLEELRRAAILTGEHTDRVTQTVDFVVRQNQLGLMAKEQKQRNAAVLSREAKQRLQLCVQCEGDHRWAVEAEQKNEMRATLFSEWITSLLLIVDGGERKGRARLLRTEDGAWGVAAARFSDECQRLMEFERAMAVLATALLQDHAARFSRVARSEAADRIVLAELMERGRLACILSPHHCDRRSTMTAPSSSAFFLAGGNSSCKPSRGSSAQSRCRTSPGFPATAQISLADVAQDECRDRLLLEDRCRAVMHGVALQARHAAREMERREAVLLASPNLFQSPVRAPTSRTALLASPPDSRERDSALRPPPRPFLASGGSPATTPQSRTVLRLAATPPQQCKKSCAAHRGDATAAPSPRPQKSPIEKNGCCSAGTRAASASRDRGFDDDALHIAREIKMAIAADRACIATCDASSVS